MSDSNASGVSDTYPKQCSALRKNEFALLKGKACKIAEMSTSKTGKHGHAKVHLVGIDIFDGKKVEDICPSTHNMEVPYVVRKEYQLLDMTSDGFTTLMSDDGTTREDVRVSGDMQNNLQNAIDDGNEPTVTVLKAMGREELLTSKMKSSK